MAQRVLNEGRDWSYVGQLALSERNLDSHVACPFTLADDTNTYLIANELMEQLVESKNTGVRLELVGRTLNVDNIWYVVIVSYKILDT